MDNTRYIDVSSWEICDSPDGFIPVDKGIAQTICALNKKGYITSSSCEGHHDIKFVDIDEVDIAYLDEFKDDPRAIIKNINDDTFDYWVEVFGTSVYVVFADDYELPNIPEGFKFEDNTLKHNIEYYDSNLKRKEISLIKEEIRKYNKILYEWASNLPDNKRKDD